VGKTDFDFFPPELARQYYADEQSVVQSGTPIINREERTIDPQGRTQWLLTSKVPLRDHTGAIIGLVGICRDITERKRREEEIRRQSHRLQTLNAVITTAAAASNLRDLLENALNRMLETYGVCMGAAWTLHIPGISTHTRVVQSIDISPALAAEAAEIGRKMARVIQQAGIPDKQPLAVEDWEKPNELLADLAPIMRQIGIRSALWAPIMHDQRRIGAIVLAAREPRSWSAEEITLAEAIGRQLGTSAERLHLLEETSKRAKLMSKLVSLSSSLNRPSAPEEVAKAIGQAALELSGADRVNLYGRRPDNSIVPLWTHGLSQTYIDQALQQFPRVVSRALLQKPEPIFVPDTRQLPADSASRHLAELEGYRAFASWPLVYEGRTVAGLTCYYDTPHEWSDVESEVMKAFVGQAAIALENARLYVSLQETNQQLREAVQAKEEMVQNVSHELRTPLTLVRGYNELLRGEVLGPLTQEQRSALDVVHKHTERLHFMIHRLLTLQTLAPESFHKIKLDLGHWLKGVVADWRRQEEEHPVRFHLDLTQEVSTIEADPDLLHQVMDNLLDNAIKFSPNGGEIRIRVRREANEAILAVSDEGVGIPPDKLELVFERFYQVEGGSTRRFGGMGVGLALCKKIVEGHGGRIWAESAGEGRGSTFYVALPLVSQHPPPKSRQINYR
ncbi:MAG: GAF domain-containing protein, partial [Anaerolineae bacterium]|nr:GAF domain-containing protein [Anaerolineae bacterium]